MSERKLNAAPTSREKARSFERLRVGPPRLGLTLLSEPSTVGEA